MGKNNEQRCQVRAFYPEISFFFEAVGIFFYFKKSILGFFFIFEKAGSSKFRNRFFCKIDQ